MYKGFHSIGHTTVSNCNHLDNSIVVDRLTSLHHLLENKNKNMSPSVFVPSFLSPRFPLFPSLDYYPSTIRSGGTRKAKTSVPVNTFVPSKNRPANLASGLSPSGACRRTKVQHQADRSGGNRKLNTAVPGNGDDLRTANGCLPQHK